MTITQTINALFCVDDKYMMPMLVALQSMVDKASPHTDIHLWILASKKNTDFEKAVRDIAANFKVTFCYFNIADLKLNLQQSGHLRHTLAQYYRLFLTSILPPSVHKIIYFDCDVLINDCVSKLWNLDFGDAYCLATHDSPKFHEIWSQDLRNAVQITEESKYFNSGVMLINLQKWREHKICEKALEFHIRYGCLTPYWDQCALNYALDKHWNAFPNKWNMFVSNVRFSKKEIENGGVFHFSGHFKPWKHVGWNKFYRAYYTTYQRAQFDKSIFPIKFGFEPRLAIIASYPLYLSLHERRYLWRKKDFSQHINDLTHCLFHAPVAFLFAGAKTFKSSIMKAKDRWKYRSFAKIAQIETQARLDLSLRDLLPASAFSEQFSFVQIGAHDGRANDPIFEMAVAFDWRGILVEPQPAIFKKLKQNYSAQKNLMFSNVAIAKTPGVVKLYTVKNAENLEVPWATQIASLRKDVLLKHDSEIPNLASSLQEIEVPALTFQQLLEHFKFRHVDLLAIDAEGYDFEILKSIDFKTVRPSFIRFEHKHLSRADYKQCSKMLASFGYKLYADRFDTLAKLCYVKPEKELSHQNFAA